MEPGNETVKLMSIHRIASPSASHVPLSASNKLAQEANTPLWNDSPVISTHGKVLCLALDMVQ